MDWSGENEDTNRICRQATVGASSIFRPVRDNAQGGADNNASPWTSEPRRQGVTTEERLQDISGTVVQCSVYSSRVHAGQGHKSGKTMCPHHFQQRVQHRLALTRSEARKQYLNLCDHQVHGVAGVSHRLRRALWHNSYSQRQHTSPRWLRCPFQQSQVFGYAIPSS